MELDLICIVQTSILLGLLQFREYEISHDIKIFHVIELGMEMYQFTNFVKNLGGKHHLNRKQLFTKWPCWST